MTWEGVTAFGTLGAHGAVSVLVDIAGRLALGRTEALALGRTEAAEALQEEGHRLSRQSLPSS